MSDMEPALIVALVSVVFTGIGAIAAVVYGRKQHAAAERSATAARASANAARTAAAIETERRHEERRPIIEVKFTEWITESRVAALKVTNESGLPVTSARLELIGGPDRAGFDEDTPPPREKVVKDLHPGIPRTVVVTTIDDRAWPDRTVPLLITVIDGTQEWTPEQRAAKLPPPFPQVY